MGEYYCPTLAQVIPAAAEGSSRNTVKASLMQSQHVLQSLAAAGPSHTDVAAAVAAAAAASVEHQLGGTGSAKQTLQLYSILPRWLASRAKQWGSCLSFKEGRQQLARAYFDAPGESIGVVVWGSAVGSARCAEPSSHSTLSELQPAAHPFAAAYPLKPRACNVM